MFEKTKVAKVVMMFQIELALQGVFPLARILRDTTLKAPRH